MDLSNHDPSRPTIRHGEVYFIPIKSAPDGKPMAAEDGRYIVGHSETGHHHTIAATDAVMIMEPPSGQKIPDGMRILNAIVREPGVKVEHDRQAHRHADTPLQIGAYEIRTQRGMTPQGWQRAID